MYERLSDRPINRTHFLRRVTLHAAFAGAVVAVSLLLGMAGYHFIGHLPWIDAFENAAMLLGGMGPVGVVTSASGKIFAGVFALYAGLVFLVTTALMLVPVFHHVLHRFHWEASERK